MYSLTYSSLKQKQQFSYVRRRLLRVRLPRSPPLSPSACELDYPPFLMFRSASYCILSMKLY